MPGEEETKNVNNQDETTEEKKDDVATTAESKNTEQEHMIPKSRFDEINQKYQDTAKRLAAMEKANKEAETKRLKESEDYKGLYETTVAELTEVKPKAEKVETYELTLKEILAAEIENIPQDRRSLIPDEMPVESQLRWISKNRALLSKAQPFDIGAGKHGGGESQVTDLSPQELQIAKDYGMTPEEYAKYKDQN